MPQRIVQDYVPFYDAQRKTFVKRPVQLVVNAAGEQPTEAERNEARRRYLQESLQAARGAFLQRLGAELRMLLEDSLRSGYRLSQKDIQRVVAHPAVQRHLNTWLTNPLAIQSIQSLAKQYKLDHAKAVQRYLSPVIEGVINQVMDESTVRAIQGKLALESTQFDPSKGLGQALFGSFLPGILRTVGQGMAQLGMVRREEIEPTLRELALRSTTFEGKSAAQQAGQAAYNWASAILSPLGLGIAGALKYGPGVLKTPPVAKAMQKPAVAKAAKLAGAGAAVGLLGGVAAYDVSLFRTGNIVGGLTDIALNLIPLGGIRRAEAPRRPSAAGAEPKPKQVIVQSVKSLALPEGKPHVTVEPTGGMAKPEELTTRVGTTAQRPEARPAPTPGEEAIVVAKEVPTGVVQAQATRRVEPRPVSQLKLAPEEVQRVRARLRQAIMVRAKTGQAERAEIAKVAPADDFTERFLLGATRRRQYEAGGETRTVADIEAEVEQEAARQWKEYFNDPAAPERSPLRLLTDLNSAVDEALQTGKKVSEAIDEVLDRAGIKEPVVRSHVRNAFVWFRAASRAAQQPAQQLKLHNEFVRRVERPPSLPPLRFRASERNVGEFMPDREGVIPEDVSKTASQATPYQRAQANYVLGRVLRSGASDAAPYLEEARIAPDDPAGTVVSEVTSASTPSAGDTREYIRAQAETYGEVAERLAKLPASLAKAAEPTAMPDEVRQAYQSVIAAGLDDPQVAFQRLREYQQLNARLESLAVRIANQLRTARKLESSGRSGREYRATADRLKKLADQLRQRRDELARELSEYRKKLEQNDLAQAWRTLKEFYTRSAERAETAEKAAKALKQVAKGELAEEAQQFGYSPSLLSLIRQDEQQFRRSPVYIQHVDNPDILYEVMDDAYAFVGRNYIIIASASDPDLVIAVNKDNLLNSGLNLVFSRADFKGNERRAPFESSWLGETIEGYLFRPALIVDDPSILYQSHLLRQTLGRVTAAELNEAIGILRDSENVEKHVATAFDRVGEHFAVPLSELDEAKKEFVKATRSTLIEVARSVAPEHALNELRRVAERVAARLLADHSDSFVGTEGYERVKAVVGALYNAFDHPHMPQSVRSQKRGWFNTARVILQAWALNRIEVWSKVSRLVQQGKQEQAEQLLRALGYTGSVEDWLTRTERFLENFRHNDFNSSPLKAERYAGFKTWFEPEWTVIAQRLKAAEAFHATLAEMQAVPPPPNEVHPLPDAPDAAPQDLATLVPTSAAELRQWVSPVEPDQSPYVPLIESAFSQSPDAITSKIVELRQLGVPEPAWRFIEPLLVRIAELRQKYPAGDAVAAFRAALRQAFPKGMVDPNRLPQVLSRTEQILNERAAQGTVLYSAVAPVSLARALYYMLDAGVRLTLDAAKVLGALALRGERLTQRVLESRVEALSHELALSGHPTIATQEVRAAVRDALQRAGVAEEQIEAVLDLLDTPDPSLRVERMALAQADYADELARAFESLVLSADPSDAQLLQTLGNVLRLHLDAQMMESAGQADRVAMRLLAVLADEMEKSGVLASWRQKLQGQALEQSGLLEQVVRVGRNQKEEDLTLRDILGMSPDEKLVVNGHVLSAKQVQALVGLMRQSTERLVQALEAYRAEVDPARREALAQQVHLWYYMSRLLAQVFRGNAAEAGRLLRTYRRDVITAYWLQQTGAAQEAFGLLADTLGRVADQPELPSNADAWGRALLNGYDPLAGVDITGWQAFLVGNLLMTPRSVFVQQLITNLVQSALRLGTQAVMKVKHGEALGEEFVSWSDSFAEKLADVAYAASLLPVDAHDQWLSLMSQLRVPQPIAARSQPSQVTLPGFVTAMGRFATMPYQLVFDTLRRADLYFAFTNYFRAKADLIRRSEQVKMLASAMADAGIHPVIREQVLRKAFVTKMLRADPRIDAFALQQSQESVFQVFAPGPAAHLPTYRAMHAVLHLRRELGVPGMVLMPILSFAMESLRQAAEMSLGPLSRLRFGGGRWWKPIAKEEAPYLYAKWLMGASLMLAGYFLRKAGVVTTAAPEDERERSAWYALGYRPYSILIGDYNLPYVALGPFMIPLALGAMMYDIFGEKNRSLIHGQENIGEKLYALAGSVGRMTVDQTVLYTMQNLFGVVSGDPSAGEIFGTSILQPVIPGYALLRSTRWLLDETVRDPEGFAERIANFLPYASRTVPPKLTVSGREVKMQFSNPLHRAVFAYILPVSKRKADPMTLTMAAIGYSPGDVHSELDLKTARVQLPRPVYLRYVHLVSHYFAEQAQQLISEDGKVNFVLQTMKHMQDMAKQGGDPRLAVQAQEMWKNRFRAMMVNAALRARGQLLMEYPSLLREGKLPKDWAVRIPMPKLDLKPQPYKDYLREQLELGKQLEEQMLGEEEGASVP